MRFSMIQTSTRSHPFFSLMLLLFAACLLFSAVSASHAQESNSEVHIPDPGLRAAISEVLFGFHNPSHPITQEDMQGLRKRKLRADERNISDLTGLEHATNLEFLDLHGNNISDISPLRNLRSLTELYLGRNSIVNISPLSGLTKLKNLGLANNPVSDFSPIEALIPKLTWYESSPSASQEVTIEDANLRWEIRWKLRLANDHTITAGDMRKLRRLEATGVSSLKGLEYATQLTTLRIINSRQLSDISALSKLWYLTTLDLSFNNISDLSPLSNLMNLKTLDLSFNNISTLPSLHMWTVLDTLDLSANNIVDISPLSNLHLTALNLSYNEIVDISPLSGLIDNLRSLHVRNNKIRDISPKFWSIADFDARGNPFNSGDSSRRSKRSTETDDLPAPGSTDGSPSDTPNSPLGDLPDPGSTDVPASDTPNGPTDNLPNPGSNGVPATDTSNGLTDTQTTTGLETTEVNLRDVNRDGKVDTDDAEIVFRLMGISEKKLAEVAETDEVYPDVDEDGDVDEEDLKEVGGSVEGSKNPDDSSSQ